jgi:hypothetical protein
MRRNILPGVRKFIKKHAFRMDAFVLIQSVPTVSHNVGFSSLPKCCVAFIFVLSDQSRQKWSYFNLFARTYVGSRSIKWFGRGTNLKANYMCDIDVDNMDVSNG